MAKAQACADYIQHILCVSRGTWYEGSAQLLSLTELKSQYFLALVCWIRLLTNERREEIGVPRENAQQQYTTEYATVY